MDEQESRKTPDAPEEAAQPKPGDKDPKADRKPSKSDKSDELVFDEDVDSGGDPYNSTGSHVILELQKVSGDE